MQILYSLIGIVLALIFFAVGALGANDAGHLTEVFLPLCVTSVGIYIPFLWGTLAPSKADSFALIASSFYLYVAAFISVLSYIFLFDNVSLLTYWIVQIIAWGLALIMTAFSFLSANAGSR